MLLTKPLYQNVRIDPGSISGFWYRMTHCISQVELVAWELSLIWLFSLDFNELSLRMITFYAPLPARPHSGGVGSPHGAGDPKPRPLGGRPRAPRRRWPSTWQGPLKVRAPQAARRAAPASETPNPIQSGISPKNKTCIFSHVQQICYNGLDSDRFDATKHNWNLVLFITVWCVILAMGICIEYWCSEA